MNGKSNRDAALQEAFEEAGIRGKGSVEVRLTELQDLRT